MKFTRDHGVYDTEKLWEITKNNKLGYVSTNKLKYFLNVWLWHEGTPNEVLSGKKPDIENHFERVKNADTSKPLLLGPIYPPNDNIHIPGDIDLYDGLHRLAKALTITHEEYLPYSWVTKDQLDQAKFDPSSLLF